MVDNNCIIEGNVKFRDGKKWKSRWCVMRKLSPVADCLHLQLYGDSKDRYKQGQTKASLSLQHFLGVQSGFTLDKESNTIAIICQDVTVVLAFDTRERLIQWQVKISNNLGEDRSFLVLISSAPNKAKLSTGPAQLHVQEHRFCMTVGIPPRLVGTWEIGQLRRYGVVEGRFCFEGGSRCGRGEGLHVLISDQAEDIVRALQLAAEGKLSTRCKRPMGLGLESTVFNSLQDSPRRKFSSSVSFDEHCATETDLGALKGAVDAASYCWSSAESRNETDCETDYSMSRASELGEPLNCSNSDWQSINAAASAPCLERCISCNSKLSKSGTSGILGGHLQPRAFDRISLSSYSSSSHDSDYSSSPQPQQKPSLGFRMSSPSPLALPPRPPKPSTVVVSKPNKPPMPLPPPISEQPLVCTCSRKTTTPVRNGAPPALPGSYENYDIPKTLFPAHTPIVEQPSPVADLNYDTPRKLKESLTASIAYPNYDIPLVPQAVVRQQCGCPTKLGATTPKSLACPCHNVMSWAGFMLPYCRRGAGIEPTGVSLQPVRLSGEGKMPVMNACGKLGIYNSASNGNVMPETSQTLNNSSHNDPECPLHSSAENAKSNYENIEPGVIDTQPEAKANYANIDFTESLGNYENSRDLLIKINKNSPEYIEDSSDKVKKTETGGDKTCEDENSVCNKCGHMKEGQNQDYLIVDEEKEDSQQPSSSYLPMQPVHNTCPKEVLSRLNNGVKSSSNPALSGTSGSPLEINRKRSESEYRVPGGSAILSSPYFRRRLLEMSNAEAAGNSLGMMLRKRSYSAESAHQVDKEKNTFTSNTIIDKCPESDAEKVTPSDQASDSVTPTNPASPDTVSEPPQPLAAIKIRRSSSVPSKTGHNRDSSSSNDSGVSTGSLSHRTTEFVEYEFPVTPANTLIKKQSVPLMYRKSPPPACYHSSLPRKSKSSDPLKDITFQFHKYKLPEKSSSAEADIPTCLPAKASKEFSSPGEVSSVPYVDSRSTSSGTSDMSDYIETLSLSSHSSSDAPDNLRIGCRAMATTLRPRSGKEYYKIDRSILVDQSRTTNTTANYANYDPLTAKESH